MKNFFKKKKQKQAQEPRELKDIKAEYDQLTSRAGQAQYMVYVYGKELDQSNRRMLEVNQEAEVRQRMDRALAEAAKKDVTPNEKS